MNSVKPPVGNTEPSPEKYMARKNLVLRQDRETGCIIPISHKLNPDGYFRKNFNGFCKMYHIHVWEQHYGEVPAGYEIHHICGNRACCNIEHLQLMEGRVHASHSNSERYRERYESAREYWNNSHCSGTELGMVFDVSWSTACRWIRHWKREGVETSRKA